MENCSNCPFFGLTNNKKDCSNWGCTRPYCVDDTKDFKGADYQDFNGAYYEELAQSFGFETAQDLCEVMFRAKF